MKALKESEIWERLDGVLGAGMLTTIAIIAMFIGYDGSVAQISITGVVALLTVKAVKTVKSEVNNNG